MATRKKAVVPIQPAEYCGNCRFYRGDDEEGYLGPQGNKHWHGVVMLHNVEDGQFDEVYIPLHYLKAKYAANPHPPA